MGTVMTHPDCQGRGLTRKLMEKVMDDFSTYDLNYLFAIHRCLAIIPSLDFVPWKKHSSRWTAQLQGEIKGRFGSWMGQIRVIWISSIIRQ
ncbi:hypothetical protein [Peribacillus sp. SCS-37]|uniref:hypothetical protein n=1 Tax=Paraperibacillus esterisolvens TaxID=3115296 RepID=UPI0039066FB5